MKDDTKDTETSRAIIVRLPIALHKALRIRVAEDDTTIQDWVMRLVDKELSKEVGGRRKS